MHLLLRFMFKINSSLNESTEFCVWKNLPLKDRFKINTVFIVFVPGKY
jgi:hypothetical protein